LILVNECVLQKLGAFKAAVTLSFGHYNFADPSLYSNHGGRGYESRMDRARPDDCMIEKLQLAAERASGLPARHVETSSVVETSRDETIWEGVVETFQTDKGRVYCWAVEGGKKPQYLAVLGKPLIDSPLAAVRAWMASVRKKLLKLAIWASVGGYVLGVGWFLVARAAIPLMEKISLAEAFYGPAVSLASAWIISGFIWLPPRFRGTKPK